MPDVVTMKLDTLAVLAKHAMYAKTKVGVIFPSPTFEKKKATGKWQVWANGQQEPTILPFSIPISILRLFLRLVDFDADTDTKKSENFDSNSNTDIKVKKVL